MQASQLNSLPPEQQTRFAELKKLQAETQWRIQNRNSILRYVQSIDIPGVPTGTIDDDKDEDGVEYGALPKVLGAHHVYWLERLQDVVDGKIKRLLGLMPPGSAKSTYTSVVLPTYAMGRKPAFNFIGVSYGSDLSRKFGRRGRTIAKSSQYARIFDCALSPESSAADEWELTNGSTFMGGGILSGVTGNRADGIVWDDLIKGRDQADSETIRNKTWDAYFDDLLTRKKPGAWEVGVITRWHEDDPAGRILPHDYAGETGWVRGRDGNDWFVVCFPAIAERADDPLGRKIGERIWPEWFPEDHFEPFKTNTRTWASLYQQRPAPDEGLFFKREWLQYWSKLPSDLYLYGASDYAVTDAGGDYTVHLVAGIDGAGDVYIVDLWRNQTTPDRWIEALLDLMARHEPLTWAEEQGQIIKSVGPFLERRMAERNVYCAREAFASAADKPTRARAFQARMASGKVYLPENAPWLADFVSELLTFPAGKNDDQVDAASLMFRLLAEMTSKGLVPTEKPKDRWDRVFDRDDDEAGESWKVA